MIPQDLPPGLRAMFYDAEADIEALVVTRGDLVAVPPGALRTLSSDEQDVFRLAFGSALAEGDTPGQATVKARQAVGQLHAVQAYEKAFNPNQPRDEEGKAAPKTLYVKRQLLNADEVRAWAATQGLATALPAEDMHVTVAFSKEPVDWSQLQPDTQEHAAIVAEGRQLHQFPPRNTPNGALVLKFKDPGLERRWHYYRAGGASWDFPDYQPHVTLTYSVPEADVSGLTPYTGPLVFGPEEWAEVNEGWAGEIREEPLRKGVPRRRPHGK